MNKQVRVIKIDPVFIKTNIKLLDDAETPNTWKFINKAEEDEYLANMICIDNKIKKNTEKYN